MIDLHCHILHGVDDGPETLEESLFLARLAHEDGITDIVATPHCHQFLRLMRADVVPRVAALNAELQRANLKVKIWPGSEIQIHDIALYRDNYGAQRLCHLGDCPAYTLMEFPWDAGSHPAGIADHIRWLREQGTLPLVAHPERHEFFRDNWPYLDAVVEAGAWIQITAGSLLGQHGPAPLEAGEAFLRRYPLAVLATDSHNRRRRSGLSESYAWVRDKLGAAREADLRERADSVLRHLQNLTPAPVAV